MKAVWAADGFPLTVGRDFLFPTLAILSVATLVAIVTREG
jgi:hypothetical protein